MCSDQSGVKLSAGLGGVSSVGPGWIERLDIVPSLYFEYLAGSQGRSASEDWCLSSLIVSSIRANEIISDAPDSTHAKTFGLIVTSDLELLAIGFPNR